jgi:hypothetical protein
MAKGKGFDTAGMFLDFKKCNGFATARTRKFE